MAKLFSHRLRREFPLQGRSERKRLLLKVNNDDPTTGLECWREPPYIGDAVFNVMIGITEELVSAVS